MQIENSTLLHVEDNLNQQKMVRAFLKQSCSAFEIHSVTTGKEAIEKLASCDYDIVLMPTFDSGRNTPLEIVRVTRVFRDAEFV